MLLYSTILCHVWRQFAHLIRCWQANDIPPDPLEGRVPNSNISIYVISTSLIIFRFLYACHKLNLLTVILRVWMCLAVNYIGYSFTLTVGAYLLFWFCTFGVPRYPQSSTPTAVCDPGWDRIVNTDKCYSINRKTKNTINENGMNKYITAKRKHTRSPPNLRNTLGDQLYVSAQSRRLHHTLRVQLYSP